jgi:hypothetical protein
MTEPVGITSVSQRLADAPGFIAFELRRYRELTDSDPSRDFNISSDSLGKLGICRRPRPENYAADTDAIAARIGIRTADLANFLRSVDAVTALSTYRPSSIAERENEGMLVAARDHADEHRDMGDSEGQPHLPGWLTRAVEWFWGESVPTVARPRDLQLPILLNLPLAIVEIEGLSITSLRDWLLDHRLPDLTTDTDRPLRGCLAAFGGVGVIFVDQSDEASQRRLTLAHEASHFVVDYLMPRDRVISRRPDLLDVLDGERQPTDSEHFGALLSDVPIGFHAHLLERDVRGGHLTSVTSGVEDRAERMALELLAPLEEVLAASRIASDTEVVSLLVSQYGLPAGVAARYASLVQTLQSQRPQSLFHAIGLEPRKDDDPQI